MTRWRCRRTVLAAFLILAASNAGLSQTLYFPEKGKAWETADPAEAGWGARALEGALDYAREQRSSSVVVLLNGRILAEGHWEVPPPFGSGAFSYPSILVDHTADGQAIEDVASVQKGVVSFLAGVAREKGLLDFDSTVTDYLGGGWSHADPEAERQITVRHLMSMLSGLDIRGRVEAPPGELWKYNTRVYRRLITVLEEVSGLTVNEYTDRWLTSRIGMSNSRWSARASLPGLQDASSFGFESSARDLARFGLLVLAEGTWRGEDVLGDHRYFMEAFAASSSLNESYGLLWWLNDGDTVISSNPDSQTRPGPLVSTAPADLVMAAGAQGRRVYVVPTLGLVVTRIGADPERRFDPDFWARLMAGAPVDQRINESR